LSIPVRLLVAALVLAGTAAAVTAQNRCAGHLGDRVNSTERFSLAPLPARGSTHEYRRRLLLDDQRVCTVNGDEISVQLECGKHFLVVTNYDYFEGVSHWFYLLNDRGVVVDQVSLPEYPGFIERITVDSPIAISFGFFGTNDQWSLTVNERGRWSFALTDPARRLNRFLFFKRRLSFQCVRGEPWSLEAAQPGVGEPHSGTRGVD
jgi:hypothetical protein